jgi:hypothetical protein
MMKAALVNSQNIVDNVIVWVDGDTWSGPEQVVVVDDSTVVGIGYTYDGGTSFTAPAPAPVPDSVKLEECKSYASRLLYDTDWTTIPDVANPSDSTPYLTNQREFMTWRSEIRQLAVNPVVAPVWPTQPTPAWGNKS